MKKKRIIVCTVAGVLLFGGITVFAVNNSNHKKVTVVPVMEMMNSDGGMNTMNMSGVITSDVSQQIYLKEGQTVKEVFVKEGDKVKVGDKLVSYDMTLENLELEMKKLDRQTLELNIKKAQRRLNELHNAKPVDPEPMPEPENPAKPERPQKPEQPQEVLAYKILDDKSEAYMGSGQSDDPYHYLVSQEGIVKGSFLNSRASDHKFFVVELREGDTSSGKLMQYWGQAAYPEGFWVDPESEYDLTLKLREKQEKEKEIPAYEMLTKKQVEEKGWLIGDGTVEKPYVFLVKKDGIVEGSFFNKMKELKAYFRIEVRKDDKNEGILLKAWEQKAELLEDISDVEKFVVQIQKQVDPENIDPEPGTTVDQKEPEAVEVPSATPVPDEESNEFAKPDDPTKIPEQKEENVSPTVQHKESKRVKTIKLSTMPFEHKTIADVMVVSNSLQGSGQEIKDAQDEIRSLQLDLKELDLELKTMERDLNKQTITSTINGVVKTVGDTKKPAQDGSPMIFVSGSEGLYVTGSVSEMQLDQVKEGTILSGFAYENGVSFTAEVREVSPYPSNQQEYGPSNVSMYPFTAYIEQAEGLKNNSWADLTIDNVNDMEGGNVVIDKAFVRSENGKYYVMIDNGKGRLKKQPVTVSKVVWGYAYEITEGLSMEDKIAFPYGKNVKEGSKTEAGTSEDLFR